MGPTPSAQQYNREADLKYLDALQLNTVNIYKQNIQQNMKQFKFQKVDQFDTCLNMYDQGRMDNAIQFFFKIDQKRQRLKDKMNNIAKIKLYGTHSQKRSNVYVTPDGSLTQNYWFSQKINKTNQLNQLLQSFCFYYVQYKIILTEIRNSDIINLLNKAGFVGSVQDEAQKIIEELGKNKLVKCQ